MYYFEILTELHKNNIKYCIVGGLALNLHNVPRMTNDLDIIVDLDRENVTRLVHVLGDMGYVPQLPVSPDDLADESVRNQWINEKNMKAFSFYYPGDHLKVVDILIDYPLSFEEMYSRCEKRNVKGIPVYYINAHDLISMKQSTGRDVDASDIALIEKALRMKTDS